MDDRRVGLVIRALRRRRGWRQVDLASKARVSQSLISLLERGHLDTITHGTLRRILGKLDARCEIDVRWRGGHLDRMLDEGHARLIDATIAFLAQMGWLWAVEVTYAIFGEYGSIDVLAFHVQTGSLLVIEVKTELTSIEETLRRHGAKVRLGPQIARDQQKWRARSTSRLLIMPESTSTRDQIARHARILDSALPAENVAVRQWLKAPSGTLGGRLFFRITSPGGGKREPGGSHRVRGRNPSSVHAGLSTNLPPDRASGDSKGA